MAFVAVNAAGERGVVGLYGQTLLPFSADYRDITVSYDGRYAFVYYGSRSYAVYELDEQTAPAPAPAGSNAGETWTCANGHSGNTGAFCTECGSPRPAPVSEDDGTWTCANGHSGNTGKFCSECGSPRPEGESDGTWTCVNGHSGNTGKFCTECGAAKP